MKALINLITKIIFNYKIKLIIEINNKVLNESHDETRDEAHIEIVINLRIIFSLKSLSIVRNIIFILIIII